MIRRIHLGCRLGSFKQDEAGITAWFFDRNGSHRRTVMGDVLIGADGIHSYVRSVLYPNEGPARWNQYFYAGTPAATARSPGRNALGLATW